MTASRPLSVIGFGSGSPLSRIVLSRVANEHRLMGIVTPRHGRRLEFLRQMMRRSRDPLADIGAPTLREDQLSGLKADIFLIASFPRILPSSTLALPLLGSLNVHMAPLPRHRGPDPIFWTYMDDDAEAGVTIHWVDAGIDTGSVAAVRTMRLARGRPSRELYFELADKAADLASDVLAQIALGAPPHAPQSSEGASYQSTRQQVDAQAPFAEWPSERVWHVLRGLGDQFSGLVRDQSDARLAHGQATSYRLTDAVHPGQVDATESGYDLHCRDGIVSLSRKGR